MSVCCCVRCPAESEWLGGDGESFRKREDTSAPRSAALLVRDPPARPVHPPV